MQKPAPVAFGGITAHPIRPPCKRDTRWYWRARVAQDGGQIDVFTGRATPDEVVIALVAYCQAEPSTGHLAQSDSELETVEDLLDAWLSTEVYGSARAHSTVVVYTHAARQSAALIGHERLASTSVDIFTRLHRAIMAAGYSVATSKRCVMCARSAWRWAYDIEAIDRRPPPAPRIRWEATRPVYTPTIDEAWRVIDAIDTAGVRDVLTIMLGSGARVGEVCALTQDDVELAEGRVLVTFGRHAGARKTGARRVPLYGPAAEVVTRLSALGEGATALIHGDRGAVSRKHYRAAVFHALKRLDWHAIGVPRFTSHRLRHLAVDQMMRAGIGPDDAAALLGHSPKMMLGVYRRVTDDDRAAAMQRAGLGERGPSKVVSIKAGR